MENGLSGILAEASENQFGQSAIIQIIKLEGFIMSNLTGGTMIALWVVYAVICMVLYWEIYCYYI